MSKELRLGFAMGGGVSLGAFSGAALTEALKLAVVRARDEDGRPYERVVVDVFSGASAGAMSLMLMLRALAEPAPASDVESRLAAQFPVELPGLDAARRRQLIAAQHAQDLQVRAWVDDIDIEKLLGRRNGHQRDLRHVASVLDRGAVEEIAARYLSFGARPDFRGRELLAQRVLFACALANLTPVQYNAIREFEAHAAGLAGLRDALVSRGHREVRVFDLSFQRATGLTASRWCRYHNADERPGVIGDLREERSWAKLGATCIACGAFPFAFEPVVLKRRSYEYGPKLWKEQFASRVAGDEIYLTYVDGGTFNNEPIREAFRLAAFIDSAASPKPFDRRIIFVDPRLGAETVSFCVPAHNEYVLQGPGLLGDFDGYDLQRLTSLERLKGHAGNILSAITNEATRNEANKVFGTRDRFKLRDSARDLLAASLRSRPSAEDLRALIDGCTPMLAVNVSDSQFPPGQLDLAGELERIIAEEPDELGDLAGSAAAFLEDVDGATRKPLWLRALTYAYLDLLMDLEGKHEGAKVIAITPVVPEADGRLSYRPLPGHELFGFAGFTSRPSREFQVERARYCAELLLTTCGLTAPSPDGRASAPEFQHEAQFARDLEIGVRLLGDRVGDVISNSHLPPVLRDAVAWYVARQVRKMSRMEEPRRPVELRIQVPDSSFELDGEGLPDRDRKPERINGRLVLLTNIDWRPAPKQGAPRWSGPNVDEGRQTLRVDTHRTFILGGDKVFCHIQLPSAERVAALDNLPHPRFEIELTPADQGKTLGPERWAATVAPPASLEDSLLRLQPV